MLASELPSLPTVVALVAGWYLVIPLIVWGKLPKGAAWQTEPFDPARDHVSPQVSEFLRANIDPLLDAGFRQAGDLIHRGGVGTTRVAVLTHPDGVVCTVVVFATPQGTRVPMVEFTALLTNGTVLDVNNAPSLPIFALRSDHIVHRFPEVRDPIRLYRAYQALLRRDCGAATLTQPDVSDPVSYLKVATEREYRRQVATGYYRFDERTGQYTTTLKGAYQMAWKLMFPMKLIRTALLRERSRATLREIGMAGADQRPVALRER